MKKLTKEAIEQLALKMRLQAGLNPSEPIHTKTLLRKLGIMVIYRPLSEKACGLSMRSADGRAKFMLINSENSRGRQHFTICHELFHLYYDEEPKTHICGTPGLEKDPAEINACLFLGPAFATGRRAGVDTHGRDSESPHIHRHDAALGAVVRCQSPVAVLLPAPSALAY